MSIPLSIPAHLLQDSRVTWTPKLNPMPRAVVGPGKVVYSIDSQGIMSTVPVPTGKCPIGVALDLCQNNAGDWIGLLGDVGGIEMGHQNAASGKAARSIGYQGISLVGLDQDPSSSTCAVIHSLELAQAVGVQDGIALMGVILDSRSIMPIFVENLIEPGVGHLYLEDIRVLSVPASRKALKGGFATTRVIRLHGRCILHAVNVVMAGGIMIGDGLEGATEHFIYGNCQGGDSEVIDCKAVDCQYTGYQGVGRYTDRILRAGKWIERFPFGKLLIEDFWTVDCGSGGATAVTVAGGGLLEVTVRNMRYEANLDGSIANWKGQALLAYLDHKAYELDEVNYPAGQGPAIARGYSMDPAFQPESDGMSGVLPDDGLGTCRSFKVYGGSFKRGGKSTSPLFSFRNAASVWIGENAGGAIPFEASGGVIMFANTGLDTQNGRAGDGLVPPGLPPGYWQQAVFASARRAPSQWVGVPVKMGTTASGSPAQLTAAELNSWQGQ
jgi:hypothetical protein